MSSKLESSYYYHMTSTFIKDEDLAYQGKTLSAWYEEARLQAIQSEVRISRHRERPSRQGPTPSSV
ncbi:hypothetical protein NW757_014416 [Fusarium falciforme]|nr:hypothetical protein NW757_014416 [Fusarium falciforme]